MTKIDNRVVRMTFDNAQFEKGIRSTMQTLTDFEEKLKFKGASEGINQLKEATQKLDLSALTNKTDKLKQDFGNLRDKVKENFKAIENDSANTDFSAMSNNAQDASDEISRAMANIDMDSVSAEAENAGRGFSVFEAVALGALLRVGSEITNFVQNKLRGLSEYTLKPITDGFREYETQMGSIQTIMANTGMDFNSQSDIQLVNSALDELNEYADLTIYNFTEMTRNIGTFTAAGVGLDTAVGSIKGIANMAALSGSNSEQASRAMYQLSQAISTGSLKLQDWNSVVNAGMGGQVFQEQLKATARAHGVAVDDMIAKAGSFRESLKEEWISSEILTETLENMTIQYESVGDEAYNAAKKKLLDAGYSEDAAIKTLKLAKASEEAATKVRTFSQLTDTVKEAIGSSWSMVWRNIIGDFGQATDLFTRLSDAMSGIVENTLGGIVEASDVFNRSGARALIFGDYQYALQEELNEAGEAIKDENGEIIKSMQIVYEEFKNENGEMEKRALRIPGLLDTMSAVIEAPAKAISDAFNSVFSLGSTEVNEETGWSAATEAMGEMMISFALAANDFAGSLQMDDRLMTSLRITAENVFMVLKMGISTIADLVAIFFKAVDAVRLFTDPLLDIAGVVMEVVTGALAVLIDSFLSIFSPIRDAIANSEDFRKELQKLSKEILPVGRISKAIREFAATVYDAFMALYNGLDLSRLSTWLLTGLRQIYDTFVLIIHGIMGTADEASIHANSFARMILSIVNLFRAIFNGIGKIFDIVTAPIRNFINNLIYTEEELAAMGDTVKTPAEKIADVFDFITRTFEAMEPTITSVINFITDAVNGVMDTISSVIEFITDVINDTVAGNGFVSIFTGIYEIIKGIVDVFSGDFLNIFNSIVEAFDFLGDLNPFRAIAKAAKTFKSKTLKDLTKSASNFKKSFVDKMANAFDYLDKVTPKQFLDDFLNSVQNLGSRISTALSGLVDAFRMKFPTLYNIISTVWNSVAGVLKTIGDSFYSYLAPILENSSSFPEAIGNIFVALKDSLFDNLKKIPEWFAGIKSEDITKTLMPIKEHVVKFFEDMFATIENLPIIGDAITNLRNLLTDAFSPLASLFGGFDISADTENIETSVSDMAEGVASSLDKVDDKVENISGYLQWVYDLADSFQDFGSILSNIKQIITDKISPMSKSIEDFIKYIKDWPSRIGDTLTSMVDNLSGEGFTKVMTIFDAIVTRKLLLSLDGLIGATSKMFKGFGTLAENAGKFLASPTKTKIDKAMDDIRSIAISLAILVGALVVLALIPQDRLWECVGVLAVLAVILVAVAEITDILSKQFGNGAVGGGGATLFKIAIGLLAMAAALKLLVGMVEEFSQKDPDTWMSGLLRMFFMVLILCKAMSVAGPDAAGAGAGLLLLGFALKMLIPIIETASAIYDGKSEDEIKNMLLGLVTIVGFVAALCGAMRLAGKNAAGAGLGMLLIAISLNVVALALSQLSAIPVDSLVSAGIVLGILAGLFAAVTIVLMKMTNGDKTENSLKSIGKIANGFIKYSISIAIIAGSLIMIGQMPMDKIIASGAVIGAIMAVFGIIAGLTIKFDKVDELRKVAGTMVIFGIAIAAMAAGLRILATCDWPSVAAGGIALGILMGGLFLLTKFIENPTDLIKTSMALMIFGGAIAVMAVGLHVMSGVDAGSVIGGAAAIAILMVALLALEKVTREGDLIATSAALIIFSGAMIILAAALALVAQIPADGLIQARNALFSFVVVFGILAVVLSAIPGSAAVLASLALAFVALGAACLMISFALILAVEALQKLVMLGPALTAFVTLVAQHIGDFLLASVSLGALGVALVALGAGLLIFGAGAAVAGGALLALSLGLTLFLDFFTELPTKAQQAFEGVLQFILNLPAMIGEAIGTLWTWLTTEILPKIPEFFGQVVQYLSEAIGPLQEWFFNTAVPAVGEFISGIGAKLQEWIPMIQDWITNTAIPAMGDFVKNLWNWIQTEGWPAAVEFIKGFGAKLGEFGQMLGNWVINDALPAIGKAIGDLIHKFQEIWPDIVEWGKSIPGKIMEGLGNLAEWAGHIGDEIAHGIAAGLGQGIDWIVNAVTSLGDQAFDAICNFFGINSPSKLMRDTVGLGIDEGIGVGILKYASYATDAAKSIAGTTTNAVNDGLNSIDGVSPTITPVLNMNSASTGLSNYLTDLGQIDFSGAASFAENLDANLDMTSLNTAFDNQSHEIAMLRDQNQKLLNEISALRADVSQYNDTMSKTSMILDSGALVGAMTPQIDRALGARMVRAERGVY